MSCKAVAALLCSCRRQSYLVGAAWFPVTGGLFLGDDAVAALNQTSGHFPDSQDQRNTLRTRSQYRLAPRMWLAGGTTYGSVCPSPTTAMKQPLWKNMASR